MRQYFKVIGISLAILASIIAITIPIIMLVNYYVSFLSDIQKGIAGILFLVGWLVFHFRIEKKERREEEAKELQEAYEKD